MSPDRLIYMANQIGKYFSSQRHTDPAAGIADHLAKFWDPSMRAKIIEHLEHGGAGLDLDVKSAVRLLAARDPSRSADSAA
ncbi:NAD-linked formate dehydrogenase, molybdenum containing, delta subunit [Methylocella tundrae]|uniref:Formate dehydrogenase n=1 Tax=Methylocella tundrae TaxID=227605 RepID=A0A4U8Z1H6_METTU|nr:formate dehydrogenase subunit delta [Methylocella tundrae]WPP03193.1 formate dehydrogenase subunit delta [Methylocella tundrae]VFU09186.1 Formate dehydrogenase [Methylocella tundrae]VTZ28099.1 NAD-linked formate dehydrogenase, molybdenum containing, delta subunit [Methylocella tundrae]VTZ48527.1 NAD-linked formate dehydrogenase, molybdenum containing, delta subunit [Methylocella tundrae]